MAQKTVRAPMSRSKRAAQFAMFDALKGLKQAIAAKEKIAEPRRELGEDRIAELNETITSLQRGQMVTAVYYCEQAQEYHQLTGLISKIDALFHNIQIGDMQIFFRDLYSISTVPMQEKFCQ